MNGYGHFEKKEASSRKSQPLLTYEKHRVKITLLFVHIKILFFFSQIDLFPTAFFETLFSQAT